MKFKVGDKVRVIRDKGTRNREFTISDVDKWGSLNRYCDVYQWFLEEELELVEHYKTDAEIMQELIEGRNDKVNSPSHYTRGDIEVIDIIKQLTQGYEPFEAYLVGNAIKYLARANFKENKQQDLEKAEWHINKLLEEEE